MPDFEGLSVVLNAKVDQFKKEMATAVQDFDQQAGLIDSRNKQLTQNIEKNMESTAAATRVLTSALKGLLSVTALQQLASGIVTANLELAKFARTAELAGVSVERLQQLQYANKRLGGIDPSDTSKSAHDLTLAAAEEVRNGEGKITTLLDANNLKLTDRSGKLKDINQLWTMAADLISHAATAADKIRIAEIFHLSEDMVKSFEKGSKAFADMQDEAKQAGAIIDSETIKKAQEFERQWSQAWSNFTTYAKTAAAEIAQYFKFLEILKLIPGALQAVGHALGLGQETSQEAKDVLDLTIKRQVPGSFDAGAVRTAQQNYVAALAREAPQREREEIARRGQATANQAGPFLEGDPRNDLRRTTVPGSGRSGATDDFERAYNSLLKQTEGLRAQAGAENLVGKALDEHVASEKILQAAQDAGITLTRNQVAEVHSLAKEFADLKEHIEGIKFDKDFVFQVQQLGRTKDEQSVFGDVRSRFGDTESDRAKDAIDKLTKLHELTEAKDVAGGFIKGLITDLENGVRAGKALENQLKRIADKLLDKGIDSLLSGLFGGLGKSLFGSSTDIGGRPGYYGPGFAGGGIVGRDGTPTLIHAAAFRGARHFQEGGGVPAIVHEGELILNRAQQKNVAASMGTNGGGPINLTHAPVLQGLGLSKDEVFAVMQRSQKEFARQIGPIFADWQRRHA